jgi:hypothetical protein
MRRNRQDGCKARPNGDGDGVIIRLTSPTLVCICLITHLNVDSGPGRGEAGLRGDQESQGEGAGLAGSHREREKNNLDRENIESLSCVTLNSCKLSAYHSTLRTLLDTLYCPFRLLPYHDNIENTLLSCLLSFFFFSFFSFSYFLTS